MNNTTDAKTDVIQNQIDLAYFVASVILFLPTVIGNCLILISLYRFWELRSPMGILIGNLAVSDLLVGVVLIPIELLKIILDDNVFNAKYPCLVSTGMSLALTVSSVLNMLAISVERFMSVAYPLKHRSAQTKSIVKRFVPFMWITVLILGFLPLTGLHKKYNRHMCIYNEIFLDEYTIFITSFYSICIIVNVGLFASVVRIALRKLQRVRDSDTSQSHVRLARNLTKTYVMMMVSGAFIICWVPFSVLTIVGLFHQWKTYSIALRWAYFLGFLNSGINWMIYGFKTPKFRKSIKAVVTCRDIDINSYISNSNGSIDNDRQKQK